MVRFRLGVATILVAGTLSAGPLVFNLAPGNIAVFDNAIIATGASVQTIVVGPGQSTFTYVNPDSSVGTLTVYRSNDLVNPAGAFETYGLTGFLWGIDPYQSPGELIPGQLSGLTFVFSTPVNAFGLMIGDWATCCMDNSRPPAIQAAYGVPEFGSGLWINFNGGAFTMPANALTALDNPGVAANGQFVNFIGAIDPSGTFTTISFFGDGFGEYLLAGSELRFASVPLSAGIPEPATWGLFAAGLGLMAVWRRRRQNARTAAAPAPRY